MGKYDMRRFMTIVEEIDQIDQLIKRGRFSPDEIEDATCGLCGTFALALHRYLRRKGIQSQLVVFTYTLDDPLDTWQHVAVEVGGRIYDIRGRVDPKYVNSDFGTAGYVAVDEAPLIKSMRSVNQVSTGDFFAPAYSHRAYHNWRKRF